MSKFVYLTLFLSFITGSVCRSQAAQVMLVFRDSVMVNDTVITLGDIAEIRSNVGQWRDMLDNFVVGDAAPAGYSRYLNREDLLTYKMQSQLKSVQIIASGAVRTLITTNYKEYTVNDFQKRINQYLESTITWPKGTWAAEILNGADRIKLLNLPMHIEFNPLTTTHPKGQFVLQMAIMQGGKVLRGPVRCEIKVTIPVVVASGQIERGEVITADQCKLQMVDITHYSIIPCDSLSQVVGKRAQRTIQAGNVLTKQWIEDLPVVEKGDPLKIIATINKVMVAVDAIARESGTIGEKIWVENAASHKMVRVVIKAKGRAEL